MMATTRLWRTGTVAMGLIATMLLCACVQMPVKAPDEGHAARVRFRLASPGRQHVFEAVPNDCFLPTESTNGRILTLSYNPDALRWVVERHLDRIGMPAAEGYPSISYTEAFVNAGYPIGLRFMLVGPGIYDTYYAQVTARFEPGRDYEVLTENTPNGISGIAISELVPERNGVRVVPLRGVLKTPYCIG
ncbi:hypothetical protein [Cupriavidus basilensis]